MMKSFKLDLFRTATVYVAESKKELKALRKKLKLSYTLKDNVYCSGCVLRIYKQGSPQINIVCFVEKEKDARKRCLVCVHEATHIAQYLFEHLCESSPGKEVFAYTQEYITDSLWELTRSYPETKLEKKKPTK